MNHERSQTPTTGPLQTPSAPQSASAISPLLGLQGLIGNAGVLDLLRPQMPGAQADAGPSPLTGALQTVLQQDTTAPTPPPGGTEAPSTAVASTLADEGQTAAITSAPSSPAQSSAAQVTALDETQDGVEGAITGSPALTTAVAAELGTTPSEVQAQAQDPWQPSWWDDAVDWTVGGVGGLVDGGVDLLTDVPVLGTAAATMAPVTKFAWETLGGFAKGAGDLVGGLGHMVAHPLDTLQGLATMAEHIPGSPLKVMHKLYDVATTDKTLEETFWRNPLDVAKEDLSADWEFWKKVGGAVIDPYERSVEQGKYGEALGRGIFDIGGLIVGASEVKALGKGAEVVNVLEHASVLNKVDDSVKIASRANELGAVTDDVVRAGGKVDDATKVAIRVDEAVDLSKSNEATLIGKQADEAAIPPLSTDELGKPAPTVEPTVAPDSTVAQTGDVQPVVAYAKEKPTQLDDAVIVETEGDRRLAGPSEAGRTATESLTTDATRQHVHKGGTVTDPQSPYYGKWDGGGIHDWDGLVSRCAEDGFQVLEVAEDPATGARRVKVERRGINPKNQQPVAGSVKKTLYPKDMAAEQIDMAGEQALQNAMQGTKGTKFEPFGAKMKRDGSLADGYFEAEVLTPSGQPMRIQGWYRETPDGQRVISSHAPCYEETWPQLPQAEW